MNATNVNAVKFAELIALICNRKHGKPMTFYDICDIRDLVMDCIDRPEPPVNTITSFQVADMLQAMADGRKIDAIKLYRTMLPSIGLKDAKDVIEAAMGKPAPTLGDILNAHR